MGTLNSWPGRPEAPRPLRQARVRSKGDTYAYSFEPNLLMQELESNPLYDRIVKASSSIGGFHADMAIRPEPDNRTSTFLELSIKKGSDGRSVDALFSLLREAGVADIHITSESYSRLSNMKPLTPNDRAVGELLEVQKQMGGIITACVDVNKADTVTRKGFRLRVGEKEIAFEPAEIEYTDPAALIVALQRILDGSIAKNRAEAETR